MRAFLMLILMIFSFPIQAISSCQGKFLNPLTDIDWNCFFPLTIGGVKVAQGKVPDNQVPDSALCACSDPFPRVGITVGFWEPVQLVEVTRTPFCLVGMGGLKLASSSKKGQMGPSRVNRHAQSQYHLHWYDYPLLKLLEVIVDAACLESTDFDLAYLTEFDPSWQEESLSILLHPEAILFGNLAAQLACSVDAMAATAHTGIDALFWCAGSQGSVYPFTAFSADQVGGIAASTALVEKMTYKMHRELLLWGTLGKSALCGKYPMPVWKKSQYRLQLAYPVASCCQPYGKTTVLWGSGKEYPIKGEDFAYVVWRKRDCCAF